ncbi:hypothetical protein CHLNCDRAFT_136575 [Chlorella variabilis]|uniref:Methyltransferase domain-containing protein n=1 Tax=Chlorella variabilis TaxID=554065 RepID=E1ZKM8_CHLVA|nr:hypothetical protein CHLNCDRAFT_136575 [Chlorella variabilis]EFN53720.1 hypothetical protein CHLNCDRAFT_136575 [Chlorella variabilis]|eukprot:XP_005845822.1 hypothetical protein CHLNCDRAFT_136575 [Chlorella variabilis]
MPLRQQQAQQQAALKAALGGGSSSDGTARRPAQRRSQSKNKFRASAFRRFLIDTFGREKLREGAGVLDVAGGSGELAFELCNLNGTPATVLEPRPLELHKRIKWLLAGFYHWNQPFAHYNDRQRVSFGLSVEQAAAAQRCWQNLSQQAQEDAGEGTAAQPVTGALLPDHLRLVITPALAACLMGGGSSRERASSRSSSSCGGRVCAAESSLLDLDEQRKELQPPAATWDARRQAQHGKWHMPVAPHEPKVSTVQQDAVDGVSEEPVSLVASIATIPAAVTPPPVDKLAQPSRKKAVAWSIPVESDSEDEDQRWWAAGTAGTHVAEASSNMRSAADAQPSVEHLTSELQQQSELQQELEQRHAPEVCDATTAWHRLTQCSVIVGVYPDQATEFIVDLAIAHGKPFAVVPCCVYSCEFPRRLLCGRSVTSYEHFLQYLVAKDPGIRVATLPLSGKNRVLYRIV